GSESWDFPLVQRGSSIAIWHYQAQVPLGVERVDLDFVVLVVVRVWVDEDFEIVIVEDDRIVFGQRRPDVRLLQLDSHIEELVVPQHLRSRSKARERLWRQSLGRGRTVRGGMRRVAGKLGQRSNVFYIAEVRCPSRGLPCWVVQLSIEGEP